MRRRRAGWTARAGRRRARIARLIDRARTRWTPRGSRRMGRRRRASWWFTRSARGSADLILQLSIIRERGRLRPTIQRARDPEQHVREARIRPGGHAMRHLLGHPQEGQGGLPVPPPLLPGMHRGAPPQAVSPVPITRRICPTTAPLPPPPTASPLSHRLTPTHPSIIPERRRQ